MKLITHIESALANKKEKHRPYVGASLVGHSCERHIYYSIATERPTPTAKQQITFSIGHAIEKVVIDYLMESGIQIYRLKETLRDESLPNFQGHIDAVIHKDGVPYAVLDVKSCKDTYFNVFVRDGLRKWSEQYYAQLQAYMGFMKLKYAVLLAVNKNTGEMHEEWLMFDPIYYDSLVYKANKILNASEPPKRVNNAPFYVTCKMCPFNKICHVKQE